jgi:hypothetical protein
MARAKVFCHGCEKATISHQGGDVFCSDECRKQHAAAKLMFEAVLKDTGFVQSKDVPNLWARDGVHISIEEVMRSGIKETLARHQASCEARS